MREPHIGHWRALSKRNDEKGRPDVHTKFPCRFGRRDPLSALPGAVPCLQRHRWPSTLRAAELPRMKHMEHMNTWRTHTRDTARDRSREGQRRNPVASILTPCPAGARSRDPPVSNDRRHPSSDGRHKEETAGPPFSFCARANENLIDRQGCPLVAHALFLSCPILFDILGVRPVDAEGVAGADDCSGVARCADHRSSKFVKPVARPDYRCCWTGHHTQPQQ